MVAAGSITIPVLPFFNSSGMANIANVVCDSGKARVWNIYLGGSSISSETVKPAHLVVDNSTNAASCYVNFNSFQFSVSPYTRKSFKLPDDQVFIAVTVGIGAVQLTVSDVDLGIPDDTSQYGGAGVGGTLDKAYFDPNTLVNNGTGKVTLTNGNYEADAPNSSSVSGIAYSNTSKTYGKYYIEFTANPSFSKTQFVVPAFLPVLGGNVGVTLGLQQNGSSSHFLAINVDGGGSGTKNQQINWNAPISTQAKVALDIDNAVIFIAPIGSSIWNGKAGVTPDTPSTGFDISPVVSLSRQLFFSVALANNQSGTGAFSCAINTGNSAFADNPPSGYTAGW